MKWNKLTLREITEEELEIYPNLDFMYEGKIPEDTETVLLYTIYGVRIDTWRRFGDGSEGFFDAALEVEDVVYWMSLPDLPEEVDNG